MATTVPYTFANFTENADGLQVNSNFTALCGAIDGVATGSYRNRLINGDMRIDQRNEGGSPSNTNGSLYSADRWKISGTAAGKFSAARFTLGAGASAIENPYGLIATSSGAYSVAAGDYFTISQAIEADVIGDWQFGAAGAANTVLSFWVTGSVPGTYGGTLRNAAGTRSYAFSFPVTSSWVYQSIPIPGDIGGTWVTSGNAASLQLTFNLGAGSTYTAGSTGSWLTGNYVAGPGMTNLVANSGATLSFSKLQLETEVGSAATPFEVLPVDAALARCLRYYEKSYSTGVVPGSVSSLGQDMTYFGPVPSGLLVGGHTVRFSTMKRSVSTVTIYSPATGASGKWRDYGNAADITPTVVDVGTNGFRIFGTLGVASTTFLCAEHWTADADF